MTRRAVAFVVAVGAVLAVSVGGCAPTSGQAPTATVPATLPATAPGTAATSGSGPTVTATPFTPTPIPTGRTGTPVGGLPPTSTLTSPDPDVVAAAALTAYYRADTALDLGPADTHRRALPWTAGKLTAGIRDDRPVTGPGGAWTALAAHLGYSAVTVTRAYDDGAPADTSASLYRQFTVTAASHGRDGWIGPLVTYTDFLTLTKTVSGWRVTALRQEA